jgi:hypothetical protein
MEVVLRRLKHQLSAYRQETGRFVLIQHPFVVNRSHVAPHLGAFGEILINDTQRDLQKGLVFKRFLRFSRTLNVAFSRHFALSRAVGCPSLARTYA